MLNARFGWSRALAPAALLAALSGSAFGQNVLSNQGFPFNWTNPYGGNARSPGGPGNPGGPIQDDNVSNLAWGAVTQTAANESVRLGGIATATEDGDANRDRAGWTIRREQEFEVLNRGVGMTADLWIPSFFRGKINFFQNGAPPNLNRAFGRLEARVELLEWNGTDYVPFAAPKFSLLGISANAQADPNPAGVDQTSFITFNNAPAGRYKIRADLEVFVNANVFLNINGVPGSDVGSGVTANAWPSNNPFTTVDDIANGLITSLGYAPSEALPNSRERIGAVDARADYGVTGAGVSIGLLEPGRVFDTHAGLAGGKVTQLQQRLNQPAGVVAGVRVADGRSEHTTATAGIAAGSAGDNSQKGVAPGAGIISVPSAAFVNDPAGPGAKTVGQKQFDALAAAGARIISMSAFNNGLPIDYVDSQINANPRLLFVKSAGNAGAPGGFGNTITNPGMSYNSIVVGALNSQTDNLAGFSSFNNANGGLRKPDLVAPGENILAPVSIDSNGDGQVNDFDRRFTGVDARIFNSTPDTGGVLGTSFAAPHVSGTGALMMEYRDAKVTAGTFDAASDDFRVLKAVMLNTATRTGIGGWVQIGSNLQSNQGVVVRESLNSRLGAGMVNASGALRNYAAGEVRLADNNTLDHVNISVPTNPNGTLKKADFWDLENVGDAALPLPGPTQYTTVNYELGSFSTVEFIAESGLWVGRVRPNFSFLKAALTWARPTDAAGAYEDLPHLEMRLYMDGLNVGNTRGFDPSSADQDVLIAKTEGVGENVKILDYIASGLNFSQLLGGTLPDQGWAPIFYLQVVNLQSNADVTFGLSVTLPAPGAAALFGLVGVVAARRRRV